MTITKKNKKSTFIFKFCYFVLYYFYKNKNQLMKKIKKVKENLVYSNNYYKFFDDIVTIDGENFFNYVRLSYAGTNYGVCGIAITDNNKIILFKNFRYAPDEYRIECVKGFGHPDKTIFDAFKIELEEEIGGSSDEIIYIGESNTEISDNSVHCFIAKNVKINKTNHEEFELIQDIKEYEFDEVKNMLKNNTIKDGLTQFCLQSFFLYYNEDK